MRTEKEIQVDIDALYEEICLMNRKIAELRKEQAQSRFASFCDTYKMSPGDVVETACGTRFQIIGMEPGYCSYVRCRKIKKDGTPALNVMTNTSSVISCCKVVGHIDIN